MERIALFGVRKVAARAGVPATDCATLVRRTVRWTKTPAAVACTAATLALTSCSTTLSRDNTSSRENIAPRDNLDLIPPTLSSSAHGNAGPKVTTAIDGAKTSTPGDTDGSTPPIGAAGLPPLAASGAILSLDVRGFRPAAVAVPLGVTEKRPIVVALHGNFDRPEWQCEVWHRVTRGNVFVLCPRGVPRQDAPRALDRWTYGKTTTVRAEIDAALAALRERFDSHLDEGALLYVGFSLGAILGAGLVADDAARFPRAVLIEGGHSAWSSARAETYAKGGGKRVLFACGQRGCMNDAVAPEKLLTRLGVDVRRVFGGEVGHTYDGAVAAEIERAWDWLIADDPRFAR